MPLTLDNVGQAGAVMPVDSHAAQGLVTDTAHLRILAIDDNVEFLDFITELLQPFGFEVTAIANPVKALEQFTREKDKFQLVLLDYYMPQLDGAKTFEWLRKVNPSIKVIIVSGVEELRLRPILHQHSIDGYIRKPFRIQEALQTIRQVITKPVAH